MIVPVSGIDDAAAFYSAVLDLPASRISPRRHSFDAASGTEKWRHIASGYPSLEPVLPAPDLVVIPDYPTGKNATANNTGHVFRALNRANGSKVWESQTPWKYGVVSLSGNLLLVSDRRVHQLLNENNETSPDSWVSVLDLHTGKELWRSPIMELAVLTAPAASANMMVAGSKPYSYNDVRGKNDVARAMGLAPLPMRASSRTSVLPPSLPRSATFRQA